MWELRGVCGVALGGNSGLGRPTDNDRDFYERQRRAKKTLKGMKPPYDKEECRLSGYSMSVKGQRGLSFPLSCCAPTSDNALNLYDMQSTSLRAPSQDMS